MTAPHTLTIATAAEQIRTRRLSPVDLVRSCLQRIDQLEPRLQAWVTIDRERALAAGYDAHVTKPFEAAELIHTIAIFKAGQGRGA